MIHKIKVNPMGAVRMTRRGKWVSDAAQRYLSYKDVIGYNLKRTCVEPTTKPCHVTITFYMPIPKTESIKKKLLMINKWHTKKPDIDNLIKGVFDAANGILWKDDNQVVECLSKKMYSDEPRIEIEVTA